MLRKSIVRDFHLLAEHSISLRAQWLLRVHHRPSRPRILPLARAHFPQTRWLPAFALAIILKPIVYALRDNLPQGPPAIALLKPANLECSVFMMSPIYAMSMVGFGISFIKKRFGGSAMAATLVSKMLKSAPAGTASPFLSIIMKRVFGGRGSELIAHRVRKELGDMIYQQPVCMYTSSLQVCVSLASQPIHVQFYQRHFFAGGSALAHRLRPVLR